MITQPLDVRIVQTVTDWMGPLSTLLATVIGALIAVISTNELNKRTAQRERREKEEIATSRATAKIMELANAVAGLHLATEREIAKAYEFMGRDADLYSIMRPFAGNPGEIRIHADDLIVLIRGKEFDLATRIFFVFSSYNAMLVGLDFYRQHRMALMSKITPVSMRGVIGSVALTEEEHRKLAPDIAVANELAAEMRTTMKSVYDGTAEILKAFRPAVKKHLGESDIITPIREASNSSSRDPAA